jgi:RNA polymerase sigma-70 factor, ECF subfamily
MATITSAGDAVPCAAAALDDLSLVHACKEGNAVAFEQLVRRYDVRLFRIAQHITHNREDAEEAVQDAFLKAFRNLGSFQEKSQFSTWLFRITINESLMKLRKRHTRETPIEDSHQDPNTIGPSDIADWAPNPEQLYGALQLREILRSQLQALQPNLRVTFILRDVEGFSTEDTAEMLNVTVDAVKARVLRARLKLRQLLTKYFAASRVSSERNAAMTAVL